MNCQNCGHKLTCGCQKKIASNGKAVCANCIAAYENSLRPNTTQENQRHIWDIPKHYYPKN
jgi:protein-arginine kinase activator protein McsA